MINRICEVCEEYVSDVWVLSIKDDKSRIEISGHLQCINELEKKVKALKNLDKLSPDKVLKEIGYYSKNS